MSEFSRDEVEAAFRHYYTVGQLTEDWVAWSQLFTDDAVYFDHFYGKFHGPQEIQEFLERTMSYGSHVYNPLIWYNIDGSQIVYKIKNRADNPQPGGPPIEFESLQIIQYAGGGKWSSEEDWWIMAEMKRFNKEYEEACRRYDPDHKSKVSRLDWGSWVDWARPPAGHQPRPSWVGRDDIPTVSNVRDLGVGERVN